MKLRNFTLILTISLILGNYSVDSPVIAETLTQSPTQTAQSIWKTFVSRAEGFSILMPGKPDESTGESTVYEENNKDKVRYTYKEKSFSVLTHTSVADIRNLKLGAAYSVRAINSSSPNFQKLFLEDSPAELSGTITHVMSEKILTNSISKQDVILNGHSAKQMDIEIGTDKAVYKYRVYAVNNKIYSIYARIDSSLASSLAGSTVGFINSFKLLN